MDKKIISANKVSAGKIAGRVIGLAAGAAVAIAAGYYFYGKSGKKHRQEASAWTKKAKMEILEKIQRMKDVTEETYRKVVEEVLAKYKLIKNIDLKELQSFGEELKAHWVEISKEAAKLGSKGRVKKLEGTV